MSAVVNLKPRAKAKKVEPWYVSSFAAKTVDELNFTSRDANGRINWWDVTPPKTDYYHAHEMLGRAYAFELLDLIHNDRAEPVSPQILSYIASEIIRHGAAMPDGLCSGFFGAISEYLVTGKVDR